MNTALRIPRPSKAERLSKAEARVQHLDTLILVFRHFVRQSGLPAPSTWVPVVTKYQAYALLTDSDSLPREYVLIDSLRSGENEIEHELNELVYDNSLPKERRNEALQELFAFRRARKIAYDETYYPNGTLKEA